MKKLLTIIYVLWKKDEAFDPNYQWSATKKTTIDAEPEPSLATADRSEDQVSHCAQQNNSLEKVTPELSGVTQDRQPTTRRRLPSLATINLNT